MAIGIGVCIVWMRYASPKGKNPHSRPPYHPPTSPHHAYDRGLEEYDLGGVSSVLMYCDPPDDDECHPLTNEHDKPILE